MFLFGMRLLPPRAGMMAAFMVVDRPNPRRGPYILARWQGRGPYILARWQGQSIDEVENGFRSALMAAQLGARRDSAGRVQERGPLPDPLGCAVRRTISTCRRGVPRRVAVRGGGSAED